MNARSGQGIIRESVSGGLRPSRQINIIIRKSGEEAERAAAAQATEDSGRALPADGPWGEWQQELERMVGLDNIKSLVFEIYAMLQVSKMRQQAGLQTYPQVYHMVFKGNPGTGKTTVARLLAKLFQGMGMLAKGHLIEAERADLVGEYIGHTAQKTRELVKRALGGILFVDEAYSLARGGEKDFGKEAIDTLVKAMEDHKNQFVLILAGYTQEIEHFIMTNPGLPSRFPIQMTFPDYSIDQLIQIAEIMVKERDYALLPQSLFKLQDVLLQEKTESLYAFSNARFVRNVIEQAIRRQAVRLLSQYSSGSPGRQELISLRPEDIKHFEQDTWARERQLDG